MGSHIGVGWPGKAGKGRLAHYLVDPDRYAPPPALEDAALFKLFGGRKSLEEIDEMDISRLTRAFEAERMARAWNKVHDPKVRAVDKGQYLKDVATLKQVLLEEKTESNG